MGISDMSRGLLAPLLAVLLACSADVVDGKREQSTERKNIRAKKEMVRSTGKPNTTSNHNGADFIVAGFPKCGTTSLLYTFAENEEIEMPERELCDVNNKKSNDEVAAYLHSWYSRLSPKHQRVRRVRGLKCPVSIRQIQSIKRLESLNPETRIIVGVRHPVHFFQSYYNYRLSELKSIEDVEIPDPYDLVGGYEKNFLGVYTGLAKFEDFLMQLGKVDLSRTELEHIHANGLTLSPSTLQVFLYEMGQLADTDEDRGRDFRLDLQHFLGLTRPIKKFPYRNVLSNKKTSYPEMMNICEEQYDELRYLLISQGQKTQQWIQDRFVESEDVTIGGDKGHFLDLIAKWSEDPCQLESASLKSST